MADSRSTPLTKGDLEEIKVEVTARFDAFEPASRTCCNR